MQPDIALAVLVGPVGERLGQTFARRRRALGARHFRETAGQEQLGLVIERAQQLALPAVPHPWPDAPDVADGEDQQELQPLDRLHDRGEILDGLAVVEVARLRRHRHGEVVLDQPGDGFRVRRRQPHMRADAPRDAGAGLGMVIRPALGDVVQQDGDIERLAALLQAGHQRMRQRMHLLAIAALDLGQHADAADQVLVDRVVVVHRELHHGDDLAEVGDQPAQQPGLVHPSQIEFGIAVRGQYVEEQPVGLFVAPQRFVDQAERAGEQL